MTARTTIEALMFELRDGLGVLAEDDTRGRLVRCDQNAMRQIVNRLLPGKGGPSDPTWSEADIQTLLLEWHRLKERGR